MKLYFVKEDSLYIIFKRLEKIQNNKSVQISIDPEHAFFDNERRAKQIKDLIDSKELQAVFIAKSDKVRRFYESAGLNVLYQEKHRFFKMIHILYLFLFNIKKFHLHALEKQNYIGYVVFGFEFLFTLIVLYGIYILAIPWVTLYVTPTYEVEKLTYNFRFYPANDLEYPKYSRYLSIPFYSWYLEYKYEMSISAANIKYIQNPSHGEIKIFNPTTEEFKLVKNTRFVTEDGGLFRASNYFTIPAATGGLMGEAIIKIEAADVDEQGNIMGARWNIEKDSKLYIRNLKRSYFTKEIYAEAINNFTWWSANATGFITAADYSILSGKLVEFITKNKNEIVKKNFNIEDSILLWFDNLITWEVVNIVIDSKKQDTKQPILKWYVIARMYFHYITRTDMQSVINNYVQQRPSDKVSLNTIDKSSLTFFNEVKQIDNVYSIPTQINLVQGYNFDKDINGVAASIKSRIVGMDKEEARDIIISYPEISTVRVAIRPPRYTSLPRLKSRITIKVQESK